MLKTSSIFGQTFSSLFRIFDGHIHLLLKTGTIKANFARADVFKDQRFELFALRRFFLGSHFSVHSWLRLKGQRYVDIWQSCFVTLHHNQKLSRLSTIRVIFCGSSHWSIFFILTQVINCSGWFSKVSYNIFNYWKWFYGFYDVISICSLCHIIKRPYLNISMKRSESIMKIQWNRSEDIGIITSAGNQIKQKYWVWWLE